MTTTAPASAWTHPPVGRTAPPRAPGVHVHRASAAAALDAASAAHGVTAVTAPAGYGKSTLVAQWAAGLQAPVAWANVDRDDDVARLVRLLATAVAPAAAGTPAAAALAAVVETAPYGPPAPGPTDALLSALELLDRPVVLVVDDVHELPVQSIRAVLEPLVRYRPPPLRLVLTSRYDAALPLHRLRVQGALGELRTDVLAFTRDEVAALVRASGYRDDPQRVARLHALTGGWPVAVRLALAGGERDEGVDARLDGMEASQVPLTGYLVEEVLGAVPDALRTLLLTSSVCEVLDPELAEALVPGGAAALAACVDRELFLVQVADAPGGPAYRWHDLVAAHTRMAFERQDPVGAARAHRVVARHRRRTDTASAVQHALAAGDSGLAVEILAERWLEMLVRGDGALVERLVDLVPVATCDAPELHVARVAARLARGAPVGTVPARTATGPVVRLLELLLADGAPGPDGQAAARALLEEGGVDGRDRALGLYLVGRAEAGSTSTSAAAIAHLETGADLAAALGWRAVALACRSEASVAVLHGGHWQEAGRRAGAVRREAAAAGWSAGAVTAGAALTLGVLAYWGADHATAVARLDEVLDAVGATRPDVALTAAAHLAMTGIDAGDPATLARALHLLDAPRDVRALPAHVRDLLQAVRLRDLAAHGRVDEALALLDATPEADRHPLTRCWEAELRRRTGDRDGARRVLAGVPVHDPGGPVGALAALVGVRLVDERHAAHAALEAALDLAEPLGLVSPFLDDAPGWRALLSDHLEWSGAHDAVVADLLARLDDAPATTRSSWDLTPRERDVLARLRTGGTAEEIAAGLFVSVNTVKTHQRAIYRKLGVAGRRAAVRTAVERGLV